HEDELVRGVLLKAPWTFYSVNFVAPALPPPDFENRLMPGHRRLRPLFQQLHDAWRAEAAPVRELRVQSLLLQILSELTTLPERSGRLDPVTRLWWEIETECRRDLSRPFSLHSLSQMTRRSPATIARSCQEAVGVPPMKRLKHVRLSLARGLVLQSELTISEIAARVGYARIHELSRDYHRHFGHAPSADR
ncbi:MAG TPA: AraC family transcriptional regulator, partial [Polyangiaceae bacterium]